MDFTATMQWAVLGFVLLIPVFYIAALVLCYVVVSPSVKFVLETDIPDMGLKLRQMFFRAFGDTRTFFPEGHTLPGEDRKTRRDGFYEKDNDHGWVLKEHDDGSMSIVLPLVIGLLTTGALFLLWYEGGGYLGEAPPTIIFNTAFYLISSFGTLFVLRYFARLVKWTSRIAKVAHSHVEGDVVPLDDATPPGFKGDK